MLHIQAIGGMSLLVDTDSDNIMKISISAMF